MSSGGGLLPKPHPNLGSGARPEGETAGGRATRQDVKNIAVDQLGFFRHFASRALGELPDILRSDERILTMATSNDVTAHSQGPLIVATDRRLLLIDNDLREPPHWDDVSYLGLDLIDVGADGKNFNLSFRAGDRTFSLHVLPSPRGPDLAYLLGAELEPDRVSVDRPVYFRVLFFVLPAALTLGSCLLLDLFLPREVVLIVVGVALTLNVLRQKRRRRR